MGKTRLVLAGVCCLVIGVPEVSWGDNAEGGVEPATKSDLDARRTVEPAVRIFPDFGFIAGLNVSTMVAGDTVPETLSPDSYRSTFTAAAYAQQPLIRGLSFRPEFSLSLRGAGFDNPGIGEFALTYMGGRALGDYSLQLTKWWRVGFLAGFGLERLVFTRRGQSVNDIEIADWDVLLNLGVNSEFKLSSTEPFNRMVLDFRVQEGLLDIRENQDIYRNRVFSVMLGFRLARLTNRDRRTLLKEREELLKERDALKRELERLRPQDTVVEGARDN